MTDPGRPWYDEYRDVDENYVEYDVRKGDGSVLTWRVAKEPPLTPEGESRSFGTVDVTPPVTAAPEIVQAVALKPRDDGRKGYYGPGVELLLMDDGTVRWKYDYD